MKWIQWNLLFIFFSSLFYFHNFTTIFFWFPFSTIGFFLSRVENDTEANRQAYGKASFVLPSISICWRKRTLKLRWIFVYIRCCFYWYGTRNAWYVEKEGNENLKTKTKWPILHVALIWKIRNFKTFFFFAWALLFASISCLPLVWIRAHRPLSTHSVYNCYGFTPSSFYFFFYNIGNL